MTLKLHQIFGAHTGRVVEVTNDVTRFGRMPDSDVPFDSHADLDASGRHAEIHKQGSGFTLTDSASRNGTWVNGKRLQSAHVLNNGDQLEFGTGGPRFRVELIAAFAPSSAPFSPPGTAPEAYAQSDVPPAPAPIPQPGFAAPVPQPNFANPAPPVVTMGSSSAVAKLKGGNRMWLALGCAALSAFSCVACGVGFWVKNRRLDPAELQAIVTQVSESTQGSNVAIVVGQPDKEKQPLCSGFVVRENLAATTAQCVVAIESAKQKGATVTVLVDGNISEIGDMWRHPDHQPGVVNADVGLLRITSNGAKPAVPAPISDLLDLDSDDQIVVGSVVPVGVVIDEIQAIPGGAVFLHGVSAPSGTPLYDAAGQLVGLHAHATKEPSKGPAPGFGVRADLLIALLAGLQ